MTEPTDQRNARAHIEHLRDTGRPEVLTVHGQAELVAKNDLRVHYQNLQARNPGSDDPARWYYGIRAAIRGLAASAEQGGLAYERAPPR
jgi:hypothetical protein